VPGIRILSANFHGHDTVHSVTGDTFEDESALIIRVLGNSHYGSGDRAQIEIRGPVNIWVTP
jgi:hypothetical protein